MKFVFGFGIGFGVVGMVFVVNIWVLVLGEGGYVELGLVILEDYEIWYYMERWNGCVGVEDVFSGIGLLKFVWVVILWMKVDWIFDILV